MPKNIHNSNNKRPKTFYVLIIFSIMCIYIAITSWSSNPAGAFIALLVGGVALYITLKKYKPQNSSDNRTSQPATPAPTICGNQKPVETPKAKPVDDRIADSTSPASVVSQPKFEHHNVSGTSFRQAEIKSLSYENPDYRLTKKELIDEGFENQRVYYYEFQPINVELVEDPTNEHDPNAIKVVVDGVHVGYIKKGSCSHVKKLIHSGRINKIVANIKGGKYRLLYSEYDYDKEDDVYHIETASTDFFVSIDIYTE